jgi:hypothetical protein
MKAGRPNHKSGEQYETFVPQGRFAFKPASPDS